jgi:hypothetical protein
MRDDLLDVWAGVDWANAQLPILKARIDAWTESRPYGIVEEMHPYNREKVYKLSNVRRLPQIVNIEAGLVINGLRSSLDLLANVLSARNGFPNPKYTQFPICRSRAAFFNGKHAGHKDIDGLSAVDRQIIEDLEPWDGGHSSLFRLHCLDNVRKHRNLIGVSVLPPEISSDASDMATGFRVGIRAVWRGFKDGAIVGSAKIDAPKPDIELPLQVTLSEGLAFPTLPLLAVLDNFTRATAEIIGLFDVP